MAFKDKVGVVSRKHKKQAPVAGILRDARPQTVSRNISVKQRRNRIRGVNPWGGFARPLWRALYCTHTIEIGDPRLERRGARGNDGPPSTAAVTWSSCNLA